MSPGPRGAQRSTEAAALLDHPQRGEYKTDSLRPCDPMLEPDTQVNPGALRLAACGALAAVWLTAAFALGGYASGDRYPGYGLVFTGALLAGCLVLPLALIGLAGRLVGRRLPVGKLASALCILFAAVLSLDVSPKLRLGTPAGAARVLLLAAALGLAAWGLRRANASRTSLAAALSL